jgi:hypothetical protein
MTSVMAVEVAGVTAVAAELVSLTAVAEVMPPRWYRRQYYHYCYCCHCCQPVHCPPYRCEPLLAVESG